MATKTLKKTNQNNQNLLSSPLKPKNLTLENEKLFVFKGLEGKEVSGRGKEIFDAMREFAEDLAEEWRFRRERKRDFSFETWFRSRVWGETDIGYRLNFVPADAFKDSLKNMKSALRRADERYFGLMNRNAFHRKTQAFQRAIERGVRLIKEAFISKIPLAQRFGEFKVVGDDEIVVFGRASDCSTVLKFKFPGGRILPLDLGYLTLCWDPQKGVSVEIEGRDYTLQKYFRAPHCFEEFEVEPESALKLAPYFDKKDIWVFHNFRKREFKLPDGQVLKVDGVYQSPDPLLLEDNGHYRVYQVPKGILLEPYEESLKSCAIKLVLPSNVRLLSLIEALILFRSGEKVIAKIIN